MNEAFWMVWNLYGRSPTFKHPSESSARVEAERLARLNPNYEFVVLEAKSVAKVIDVQWKELAVTSNQIPF